MKNVLTIIICLLCTSAFAQKQPASDSTEIKFGGRIIIITKDSSKKDITIRNTQSDDDEDEEETKSTYVSTGAFGMDLGVMLLNYENNGLNTPTGYPGLEMNTIKSTHVGLHFFPTTFGFAKGHVSLKTSLSLDYNKYDFQDNYVLVPRTDSFSMPMDSLSLSKNRLMVGYFQIPLILNFSTGEKGKGFKFGVGGYAGFMIGANVKTRDQERGKIKQKDDYNLERFRYGLTARVGYGPVRLYCNYNLSTLFRDEINPVARPISFGLSLFGI